MAKLNCDEEPLKELRQAVLKKHGKIYGALKLEVNQALSERARKISARFVNKQEEYNG